jgi:hypothetical protein
MFNDYQQRGTCFIEAVHRLQKRKPAEMDQ